MTRTVLVISDLHLGGGPDFQMCSPDGRALVAEFLAWTAHRATAGEDIHLVVNGDFVDFLAETPFKALTVNDSEATRKLGEIMRLSAPVWDGFQAVAKAGAQITILLGNHDLELTLPGPNALLRERLGAGRIALLLDGQALDLGDVLIEHGNSYDAWNLVDYDALRRIRSHISRRIQPLPDFKAPPGSKLVVDVMNGVKRQFRFVDLLKPETDAVLPLLAALASVSAEQLKLVATYFTESSLVQFGPDQRPLDPSKISARAAVEPVMPAGAERALDLLDKNEAALVRDRVAHTDDAGRDPSRISAGGPLDFFRLWHARSKERRAEMLGDLYDALRYRMAAHDAAFRIDAEQTEYLTAANASAARRFKTIVYGHTHLAKCVPLAKGATYLNTGTWADLMRLPQAVVQGNKTMALGELAVFVDALEANRLDEWRRPRPTFAQIVMDGRKQITADVFTYSGGERVAPLSNEALR